MYYKIVSGGLIVDACEEMRYVTWQEKNRIFLNCEEHEADGIITSDGKDIYLLPGGEIVDGFEQADYEEITAEEYAALREEIDAGRQPEDDGGEPEPEPEPDNPSKTRLAALEETVARLEGENYMLTECLLEISEILYGGELI